MSIETRSVNVRKPWVDALRGFAMLLVIIMHVPFAAGVGGNVYTTLIGWMFMPLFFFVSGLVMYNPNRQWSTKKWCTYIGHKFMQLIVPTIIVFLFLCWVYRYDVLEQLLHPMKAGCWFTITLFGFIFLYTLFEWITKYNQRHKIWKDMILLCLTLILSYGFAKLTLWRNIFGNTITIYYDALQIAKWSYFQYFVFGVLVSKYKQWIKNAISYSIIPAIVFVIWIVVSIMCVQNIAITFFIPYISQLTNIVYVYSSITLVTYVFYYYRHQIEITRLGKITSVIGCNTLGIYLLHYFFLWGEYRFIVDFYASNPTQLIMFLIYVLVALIILVATMLLISVVKVSPVLSQLFLGKK